MVPMETFLMLLRRLQDEGIEPEEARIHSWPIAKDHEREIVLRFDADDIDTAKQLYEDFKRRRMRPRRSGDSLTIVIGVHN
jgi:hypothetical protein